MSDNLQDRINTIEEAFEYMLAYAAQGLEQEDPNEGGGIREFLAKAIGALDGIHEVAVKRVNAIPTIEDSWNEYLDILKTDASRALALIKFAQSQPLLSSELIDNLNATNHIRTVLTDIFLLDSALGAHKNA